MSASRFGVSGPVPGTQAYERRSTAGGWRLIILGDVMKRNCLALVLTVGFAVLPGACSRFSCTLLAQIDPRTALIERGAWSALRAGQAHAAAEAFREAIAADPKNARLHLGAGMAASGPTTRCSP